MSERSTQNRILRKWGSDPRIRLWRANAGAAMLDGYHVRFGVPGQADLSGVLPNGVRLEIEVKSPTGRQSKDQKNFQAMITSMNGVYILARSVEDVDAVLEPMLNEIGYTR